MEKEKIKDRKGIVMMKLKKWLCAAAAVVMVAGMAGCGNLVSSLTGRNFDAGKYVDACISFLYRGEFDAYMEQVEISLGEAQKDYQAGIESEVQYLLNQFDCPEVTPQVTKSLTQFYTDLYKKTKFEIKNTTKIDKDTYSVSVEIYPLDTFKNARDEINDFIDSFNARNDEGEFADMTVVEYDSTFMEGVLAVLNTYLSKTDYLEPQTILVQVVRDPEDGMWGIPDVDAQNIDNLIIDYQP